MQGAFGSQSPLGDLTPLPQTSLFAREEAKEQREAGAITTDYIGSMIRQDSPVDGMVAAFVGDQYKPDPSFDPYDPVRLAEDAKGLPEEYHHELVKAVSAEHRAYIRMRLDDKMADLQRLGDLGVPGTIGRFLVGFVEPTNLALGLASGGITTALRGAKLGTQIATGLGSAAAAGYAFERGRQAVNFEDSQSDAVWAGLMATAFSVPFVGLSARESYRLRSIAARELHGEDIPAVREEYERVLSDPDPIAAENGPVKALPFYAGPPLHVFPDGTTMTAGELRAAREAEGLALDMKHGGAPVEKVPEAPVLPKADPLDDVPPAEADSTSVEIPAEPTAISSETKGELSTASRPVDLLGETVVYEGGSGEVIRQTPDRLFVKDDDTGAQRWINRSDVLDAPEVDGFLAGSVGGAQIGQVPVEITPFRKARFDIAARFNKSVNPVIQRIGRILVKDPLPSSPHYAQGRSVSEDKKLLQRTVAGNFHYEVSSAYKEAARKLGYNTFTEGLPANTRRFHADVGRFMRNPDEFANSPHRAELERVANAARKVYSTMLDEMQKAGVKGAETLAANPNYLNRLWLPEQIKAAARKHGEDAVERLVANSIRDKDPIIKRFREKNPTSKLTDAEILQRSARKFILAVQRLEYSHLSNELLLTATDAPTLRAALREKLSNSEADEVIDHLFEVQEATSGDAGKPAQLKYRFNLDEGTTIGTADGGKLHLSDLMENDIRVLVDRYTNSMAGHIAMARQGIKSRADFEALLREADADHEANALSRDGAALADDKQLAHDMYNHIVGRPMSVQSFGKGDRLMTGLRSYARSVYLGQLGFTAMMESFHVAGLMTWRAAIQQMPAFRQYWLAARAGKRPSEGLVADITEMLGYFNEHVSGYLRQHEITEFTYDKALSRWEDVGNTLSHATDKLSGNSFMTSLTRGMGAAGMIQKYANLANGRLKLDDTWRKRMVGSGINADDIDAVLAQLKEHVEMEGNRVVGVKWEEWSAKDPSTYHDFITAVDRDVRQGVQDHDIGETFLWQHSSVGKIFTELRAFSIAAHSKQFLNGLHYRDRVSMQLFTTSFAVNALAYITQTSANFAHSKAELNKRLTPERIVKAAYTRSSMMGLLPFFTDTVVPGFVSPMALTSGQGLTANTDSRNVLMPPSFNLLAKGVNFMQTGDVKQGLTLLPFSNTYGARNLIDMIGKAYPQTKAPQ